MTVKIPDELVSAIVGRNCAIFAGSGITASSGGATWNGLISEIKTKFGYSSPLVDNFRIMKDVRIKYGRANIYDFVKDRLSGAKLEGEVRKMASLPWFAVFTTNYDLAIEQSMMECQTLPVCTITTGNEFQLTGLPSQLLCVKLMGSLDIPDGQPGHMVLDSIDMETARIERSRIFDILSSHAARLSFLFVGYSFSDKLFFEILDKLTQSIGTPNNKFYALFKEEPDEETLYSLEQYHIIPIVADIADFAQSLSNEVSMHDPRDLTRIKIPLGTDIVSINPGKVSGFFSLHNPVLLESLNLNIEPLLFFKGNTDSLQPFVNKWHYDRPEINAVVKQIIDSTSKSRTGIISINGPPGSGRTFTILASITRLIKEERYLAAKIQSYAFNPVPSKDDISRYYQEIIKNCQEKGIAPPKGLVFWAEFSPDLNIISKIEKLSVESDFPIHFIYEDYSTLDEGGKVKQTTIEGSISIDVTIEGEHKEQLSKYLRNVVRTLRLPEITKLEIDEIIDKEKRFLPIVYRALDPSRRSINRIIEEELQKVNNPRVRKALYLSVTPGCYGIALPISILKRALSEQLGEQVEFEEVYGIILEHGKAFMRIISDSRTNDFSTIYHPYIAGHIAELVGENEIDNGLVCLAKSSDLKSRVDAEFVGSMFIENGVNLEDSPRYYSIEGLEKSLIAIKRKQPARPILHHLARLYSKVDVKDKRIVPLLTEAMAEPVEQFALYERRENVLTTLAKVRWEQNAAEYVMLSRNDSAIVDIIGLLLEARKSFPNHVHPYDYQVRILKEMASQRSGEDKFTLINEAVEVISEGLDYCQEDEKSTRRLNELLVECLAEIDYGKALRTAEDLLDEKRDGAGYYTLAVIEYRKFRNEAKASLYLDRAMSGNTYPPGCLALKIEIIIKSYDPDYKYLLELVQKLASFPGWKDTWKSAYHQAIVFAINGKYETAVSLFKQSNAKAPYLQKKVDIFWMEEGRRKTHSGKIATLNVAEGWIFSHTFHGWMDNLFFIPSNQKQISELRRGLYVNFEIGFLPRGPIAFEVRPYAMD